MVNKVIISKKNNDGSYDTGEYLFDAVDLYGGDTVSKRLEIAPNGSPVKNLKIQLVCVRDNIQYEFLPTEDEYYLVCDRYPNLKLHFEDINGIKYKADKNGVISLINVLNSPLDIFMFLEAKPFTISKITDDVVLDDVSLVVFSS